MNLPEKYLENMKELLGTDFDAYIESFNDSRLYGLRVNTMKISVEDFLKISPFKLTPIPWIENGFYYSEDDKPASITASKINIRYFSSSTFISYNCIYGIYIQYQLWYCIWYDFIYFHYVIYWQSKGNKGICMAYCRIIYTYVLPYSLIED